MPGVQALAELVAAQIDSPEAGRAQHLRPLRCLRDLHRRAETACDGLASLVFADSCEEKEFGDDTSGDSGTHPSRETIKRGVLHGPQPVSYGL
jgi:hypothetical protein